MEKILYTKYSTERADRFKIGTSVFRDADGEKRVEKRARHLKAESHIESLSRKYAKLKKYYSRADMKVTPCELCDAAAVFPFVEGDSLECILDHYVEARDVKGLLVEIEKYRARITEHIEMVPFQVCNEFIRVFGEEYPKEGVDAYKISNIDLIFANIIVENGNWNIIDYEWVFDFPVPVDYVVYRAVKNYIEMSVNRSWLADCDIYDLLGFTRTDRDWYDSMDRYFQKYVAGEALILDNLYQNTSKKAVRLNDILVKNFGEENRNEIQIFYDKGNGYSEENSYKVYPSFEQLIEFVIELDDSIKEVRFDPGREFCMVKVVNVMGEGEAFYDLNIVSNGVDIGDGYYIFLTEDPQFYIQNWDMGIRRIKIELVIQGMKNQMAADLIALVRQFKNRLNGYEANLHELKDQINELELKNSILLDKINEHERSLIKKKAIIEEQGNYINELKEKAEQAESRYLMIENSHFWRMTKPARVLVSKIKMSWLFQHIYSKKNK